MGLLDDPGPVGGVKPLTFSRYDRSGELGWVRAADEHAGGNCVLEPIGQLLAPVRDRVGPPKDLYQRHHATTFEVLRLVLEAEELWSDPNTHARVVVSVAGLEPHEMKLRVLTCGRQFDWSGFANSDERWWMGTRHLEVNDDDHNQDSDPKPLERTHPCRAWHRDLLERSGVSCETL